MLDDTACCAHFLVSSFLKVGTAVFLFICTLHLRQRILLRVVHKDKYMQELKHCCIVLPA